MTNVLLRKAGLAFNKNKTEHALRKATFALVLVIEFKTIQSKAQRSKAVGLIESGLTQQAFMDVEQLVRQDFEIEAYDTLRRQCIHLEDRLDLVAGEKHCPAEVKQAVCTIIWAADKAEVPEEMMGVKLQLVKKYGKEFASCAYKNENGCVNKLVSQKILYQNDPSIEIVDTYLESIDIEINGPRLAASSPKEGRKPRKTVAFVPPVVPARETPDKSPRKAPASEAPVERAEKMPQNISSETNDAAAESPKTVLMRMPEDTPTDIPTNVPEDNVEATPKAIPDVPLSSASKEIPRATVEPTPEETSWQLPEETPENVRQAAPEASKLTNTPSLSGMDPSVVPPPAKFKGVKSDASLSPTKTAPTTPDSTPKTAPPAYRDMTTALPAYKQVEATAPDATAGVKTSRPRKVSSKLPQWPPVKAA